MSVALERFARQGIQATSIQDIADHAGVSKASVLYHFSSKDHLADAALTPALDALDALLSEQTADTATGQGFIEQFVDFLITHRHATHIVIAHPYLADEIASLRRAHQLMTRLAQIIDQESSEEVDQLRIGVAMAGASYALVSADRLGVDQLSDDELRPLLTSVLLSITHPENARGGSH